MVLHKGKLWIVGLVFSVAFAAPSLVNGIALLVNDHPVTLLELYRLQQLAKVPQNVAVDRLIDERLHDEEVKKRQLGINDVELEEEMQKIALQNATTLAQMQALIQSSGSSWETYREDVKQSMLRRKLYQSIAQEGMKAIDEREVRAYYDENREDFFIPQSVDVVKFHSRDSVAIQRVVQSGGKLTLPNVGRENEVLQISMLNPQVILAFAQGKEGAFTPIFPIGREYVTFLIQKKYNPRLLPYENARNVVLQRIVQEKESNLISEYFEKLRANANIRIIRLN